MKLSTFFEHGFVIERKVERVSISEVQETDRDDLEAFIDEVVDGDHVYADAYEEAIVTFIVQGNGAAKEFDRNGLIEFIRGLEE